MDTSKSRTKRIFSLFIYKNKTKISLALDAFFKGVKGEAVETKEATLLIQKYVLEGKITKEEEALIKKQAADILKIVGIGIPFVLLPGASIIIPFLIKAAERRNINLLPSHFSSKKEEQ